MRRFRWRTLSPVRPADPVKQGWVLTAVAAVALLLVGASPPVASAARTCLGLEPTIIGTSRDDVLRGSGGDDVILGLGGNDSIYGEGGHDTVCGGAGDDDIWSVDPGNFPDDVGDRFDGGPGRDFLSGSDATDVLRGGDGDDRVDGAGNGDDRLFGGDGDDGLLGGVGADELRGGLGNDSLVPTGFGNDLEPDVVDGGAGIDVVDYFGASFDLRIDLGAGTAEGTGADTLIGIENALGGNGSDVIRGTDGPNDLLGRHGRDRIYGLGDDDTLDGGDGTDHLYGGGGADTCTNGEVLDGCEG